MALTKESEGVMARLYARSKEKRKEIQMQDALNRGRIWRPSTLLEDQLNREWHEARIWDGRRKLFKEKPVDKRK